MEISFFILIAIFLFSCGNSKSYCHKFYVNILTCLGLVFTRCFPLLACLPVFCCPASDQNLSLVCMMLSQSPAASLITAPLPSSGDTEASPSQNWRSADPCSDGGDGRGAEIAALTRVSSNCSTCPPTIFRMAWVKTRDLI